MDVSLSLSLSLSLSPPLPPSLPLSLPPFPSLKLKRGGCVCVCVCVRERERERDSRIRCTGCCGDGAGQVQCLLQCLAPGYSLQNISYCSCCPSRGRPPYWEALPQLGKGAWVSPRKAAGALLLEVQSVLLARRRALRAARKHYMEVSVLRAAFPDTNHPDVVGLALGAGLFPLPLKRLALLWHSLLPQCKC